MRPTATEGKREEAVYHTVIPCGTQWYAAAATELVFDELVEDAAVGRHDVQWIVERLTSSLVGRIIGKEERRQGLPPPFLLPLSAPPARRVGNEGNRR